MGEKNDGMVSIWFWVGLVLGVYGLIVTATGIYYIFEPDTLTITGHLNPNLWWGAIMTAAGLVFLVIGRFGRVQQ